MADEPKIQLIQTPMGLRSTHYRETYVTGFTFRATVSDFSLIFLSLASPPGIPNTILNQEEGAVTMTLSTMKVLSEHLSAVVKAYEERLGPIKIDARLKPKKENTDALLAGFDPDQLTT